MPRLELYTPVEVAKILKVDISTIRRYIKAGDLKANKVGRQFRIKSDDLEAFVNGNEL